MRWSVGLVCVKYHPRRQRGLAFKDKRYFSRAIRPSSFGPLAGYWPSHHRYLTKIKIFPAPPIPVTRHGIVRLRLVRWARLFRPTFADFHPVDVLPPLGVLDQIKHATCVAKFIQYMCLLSCALFSKLV